MPEQLFELVPENNPSWPYILTIFVHKQFSSAILIPVISIWSGIETH